MKTPSIVGAQPRGKVVCAAACSSQLGRMSTNFGCGSRARACSGYVRASLAWCYLQSTLFNQIHVLQRKKDYTAASELYQSVLWAPPLAAQICLAGVHASGCPPGESPFLHDHRVRPRPFLPHGRHLTCIMDAPSRESPSSQAMRGLVQRSVAASVRPANIWRVSSASGFITCPTGVGSLESLPDPPSSGVILPADGTALHGADNSAERECARDTC